MANIDKTGCGPTAGLGAIPHDGPGRSYVLGGQSIDLTGAAIVQANVYQCLAVPPNTLVESVHIVIDTPAVGTTLTMDVGDGTNVDGWMASTDGKATAGTYDHSVDADEIPVAASGGYFYANAGTVAVPLGDSIDVVMTTATAITAGPKFRLFAVCKDLN
jgi:hypothetical protein